MIRKKKNIFSPGNQSFGYLFIDDLNLLTNQNASLIDFLIQFSGWYSFKKKTYLVGENIGFYGSFSYDPFLKTDPLNNSLNNFNHSMMNKTTMLVMDDMELNDLVTIFKSINENMFFNHKVI